MAKKKNKKEKIKKAWLAYEEIIAKAYTAFYSVLEPSYKVTHNDFVYGNNSETKRQIDISIKGTGDNNEEFLAIVSAKDYRAKISIPKIDELRGVMQDVGATKGILLCNGGFTAQTKIYARNLGIDLCTLNHLDEIQKEEIIKIPVVFVNYEHVKFNFKFVIHADDVLSQKTKTDIQNGTYADNDNSFDTLKKLFLYYWNNSKLEKKAGKHETDIDPFYIIVDNYKSQQPPLKIIYEVIKRGKVEFVPLSEYYKLTQQTRDEALEHLKIDFEISMDAKNWQKLTEADDTEGTYPGLHIVFAFNEVLKEEYLNNFQSSLKEI